MVLQKLRKKALRVKIKKARKEAAKIKKELKKQEELEKLKREVVKAMNVKGITKTQKRLLMKRRKRIEERKKANKKKLAVAKKVATNLAKEGIKFIFVGPKKKKGKR